MRGFGYGKAVFNKIIEVYQGKTFYINSAKGKEPMYAKSGFTTFIYEDLQIVAEPKMLNSRYSSFVLSDMF